MDDSCGEDSSQCRCDGISTSANNMCWCFGTVLIESQAHTLHMKHLQKHAKCTGPSPCSRIVQVASPQRGREVVRRERRGTDFMDDAEDQKESLISGFSGSVKNHKPPTHRNSLSLEMITATGLNSPCSSQDVHDTPNIITTTTFRLTSVTTLALTPSTPRIPKDSPGQPT